MNAKLMNQYRKLKDPDPIGSYSAEDCIFLLKDLSDSLKEMDSEEREHAIQSGVHYSETLPSEYVPGERYMEIFYDVLSETQYLIAEQVATVAEKIVNKRGKDVILVSLVRAGTPIGALVKRYLKQTYNLSVPHYSISIIRGRGFDENALCYIIGKHQSANLQFIDGWTGKGMIHKVLKDSCHAFYEHYGISLSDDLAVLADPSHSVNIFGTREDFLIPSACLNATISGLTSRSVLRKDLIGETGFHGVKVFRDWAPVDQTNYFIDTISQHFSTIQLKEDNEEGDTRILNIGKKETEQIAKVFGISDINRVKPGVGETTRVLLRRFPWKILVKNVQDPKLKHVFELAREKHVPVEVYSDMTYSCCGIIKNVRPNEKCAQT